MMLERYRYNFEKRKRTELPMEWDEYEKLIKNELSVLLSDINKNESYYQAFFEQHPCMLPRPFDCNVGVTDIAFPGLISHPVLPSFDKKIPDFMWITMNSSEYCATLIEIEDPTKVWFTLDGQPRAELTQAINQINSWKVWFKEPTNVTGFLDYYNISVRSRKRYTFRQGYLLIYGRRDDKTINDKTNKIRDELQGTNVSIMTYDRLVPDSMLSNALCVKRKNGHYQAISVPPTFKYRDYDYFLCQVNCKNDAVKKNTYMSTDQRNYLIKQFSGLDQWGEENISANSIEIFGM